MKTVITLFLTLFLFTGFVSDFNSKPKDILLVLKNPMDKEYFSKFKIFNNDGVLSAVNVNDDYPVPNGIYWVEATSNDRYYSKHISVNK